MSLWGARAHGGERASEGRGEKARGGRWRDGEIERYRGREAERQSEEKDGRSRAGKRRGAGRRRRAGGGAEGARERGRKCVTYQASRLQIAPPKKQKCAGAHLNSLNLNQALCPFF